jgi:hypothetical protein
MTELLAFASVTAPLHDGHRATDSAKQKARTSFLKKRSKKLLLNFLASE